MSMHRTLALIGPACDNADSAGADGGVLAASVISYYRGNIVPLGDDRGQEQLDLMRVPSEWFSIMGERKRFLDQAGGRI